MDFYFQRLNPSSGQIEMRAIVHVTLEPDLEMVKFIVDLDSLPPIHYNGYEVVAEFKVENF